MVPSCTSLQALHALLDALPVWDGKSMTPLSTPKTLLAHWPQLLEGIDIIHIAGSNGKGTLGAFLSSIFRCRGDSVAHISSPHLELVTERCRINGEPCATHDFESCVREVIALAEDLELRASYFVVTLLASLLVAANKRVDTIILEVGLGGRLDATNIIDNPIATAITPISLEHTAQLGDTLAAIAGEKAGIIKPGVTCYSSEQDPEVVEVLQARCAEYGNQFLQFGSEVIFEGGAIICRQHQKIDLPLLSQSSPFLSAAHNQKSAALAALIALDSGVSVNEIEEGIASAHFPGRVELIRSEFAHDTVDFLLDGAHNPAGVSVLFDFLETYLSAREIVSVTCVIGILRRKDWRPMLELVKERVQTLREQGRKVCFVVPFNETNEEYVDAHLCAEVLDEVVTAPDNGIEELKDFLGAKNSCQDFYCAFGSLYFVGELRGRLLNLSE